jgi:uncharacterized protein (DUF433 family)
MVEIAPGIEIDSERGHGKPLIKGTRVPVTRVLGAVAAGLSFAEVEREYGVRGEDIRAAIAFANGLVAEQAFVVTAARG